jgi:hypothetical protein
MTAYIDEHKGAYGVEPICRILAVAPSSYYAAKARPPSARATAIESWAPTSAGSMPSTTGCTACARPGGCSSAKGSMSVVTGSAD